MKVRGGYRSFFNLGARCVSVLTALTLTVYPREKETQYPLYGRLGGPQGRSGLVRITWPPPRFDLRNIQPLAIETSLSRPKNNRKAFVNNSIASFYLNMTVETSPHDNMEEYMCISYLYRKSYCLRLILNFSQSSRNNEAAVPVR